MNSSMRVLVFDLIAQRSLYNEIGSFPPKSNPRARSVVLSRFPDYLGSFWEWSDVRNVESEC